MFPIMSSTNPSRILVISFRKRRSLKWWKRRLQRTWHGWRQTASGPTMSCSLKFHWTKHQHNCCKVNSILDSSLVILDLHSTLSFLKVKLQTELITLWLSCGFCRLGYVVARPGSRYGCGGGEIRKVGCTWDKQDITLRTRKIPYLILPPLRKTSWLFSESCTVRRMTLQSMECEVN